MLTNNIPSPTKIADDNLINPLYISNFSLIFLPINDRNKPIINTNIGLVPDDIDATKDTDPDFKAIIIKIKPKKAPTVSAKNMNLLDFQSFKNM
tara:strand:- start:6 stop:287 length:282 start_codon:yes stop_codon:yes gene_type:complete